MIVLRLLGSLDLRSPDGAELREVLRQPKRTALLAYLALAHSGPHHRRDSLLAMFWPELDEARARDALSSALGFLRRTLGAAVVVSRSDEEVALDRRELTTDLEAFERALLEGRKEAALELYRADLLEGFHAGGLPAFDDWLERERRRVRGRAAAAARELGRECAAKGSVDLGVRWYERARAIEPFDEVAVRELVALLDATGNRAQALRLYGEFAALLARELDAAPAPETQAMVRAIREAGAAAAEAHAAAVPVRRVLEPAGESRPAQRVSRRRAGIPLLMMIASLAATAIGATWWRSHPGIPDPAGIRSLAVLPLENLTGRPDQAFLVEGLTQALAGELARIDSLRVVPAVSVRRFRDSQRPAVEIARELEVDGLIEGAAMGTGNRLRVTLALVDGRTDRRIWTETFERELADVLTLYSDIARSVAVQLRATLRDPSAPGGSRAINPEAYTSYLRGLYSQNRWQAGGCAQAEQSYLQAIGLDSTLAPAFAGLAYCYARPDLLGRPIDEVRPRALAAVTRALELDSGLAPAHHALGLIRHRLDYDWPAAELALRRALALDPRAPSAHAHLGELLYASGRQEEGLAHLRHVLELEPFHLDHGVALGWAFRHLRRYDDAIAQLRKTLELDPSWTAARFWLAESYGSLGAEGAAVTEYLGLLGLALAPEIAARAVADLRAAYARDGWRGFWVRELELCAGDPRAAWRAPHDRFCGPYFMARRYARLGDRGRALDALEAAYRERRHQVVFAHLEPLFDPLHGDPRFRDLLRRIRVPP